MFWRAQQLLKPLSLRSARNAAETMFSRALEPGRDLALYLRGNGALYEQDDLQLYPLPPDFVRRSDGFGNVARGSAIWQ